MSSTNSTSPNPRITPMKELTKRQQQVLDFIREKVATDRIPPTLREICQHFGFSSVKAASDHVNALRRKGMLKARANQARAFQIVEPLGKLRKPVLDIPVFGSIPAGPPQECLQDAESCVSADVGSLGIKPSARIFALRAPDDALESIHICKGDVVVCEHGRKPRDGDVVAVLLNGRSALRIYGIANRKGMLTLPGRKTGAVPAADLVIQGVMVALVRST